jgi:hypothetical protein
MSEMSDKLGEILNNPDAMSKIMELASGLDRPKERAEDPIPLPRRDERMELLYALRPLLRENRRSRLDNLTKAVSMAQVLGKMKGGR